jgi:hypothetical protein
MSEEVIQAQNRVFNLKPHPDLAASQTLHNLLTQALMVLSGSPSLQAKARVMSPHLNFTADQARREAVHLISDSLLVALSIVPPPSFEQILLQRAQRLGVPVESLQLRGVSRRIAPEHLPHAASDLLGCDSPEASCHLVRHEHSEF